MRRLGIRNFYVVLQAMPLFEETLVVVVKVNWQTDNVLFSLWPRDVLRKLVRLMYFDSNRNPFNRKKHVWKDLIQIRKRGEINSLTQAATYIDRI